MSRTLAVVVHFVGLASLYGLAGAFNHASDDAEVLLQQSLLTHAADAVPGRLEKLIKDRNVTLSGVMSMAQVESQVLREPRVMSTLHGMADEMATGLSNKEKFAEGWSEFVRRAKASQDPSAQSLLRQAKSALLQTGAMEEMRKVAARARATTEGQVPMDSMVVGFYTSLAPWNNVLKEFSLPLIKAQFGLSANFFGPEGSAARVCVHAYMMLDSTYGPHSRSEFGGIGVFTGPAKWDNVPGWRFGASGGMDNMRLFDVADFGWDWTLSSDPETVGFHFDIAVIDSEGLHASALQTNAEVQSEAQSETIPNHGSTYLGHVWCSPDWFNTPLVIEDVSPVGKKATADLVAARPAGQLTAKAAEEEEDAEDDAV
mmetsp:Transcript_80885/g.187814  ORF Transcript_80885/g.187814 Transcript_80885/m.187814 type:complete len:372 (+) Transcript_80885:61-1176(+)